MCGRYVSVRSDADLLREFDAVSADEQSVEPDYNVAPTKPVRIVVNRPLRDAAGIPDRTPTRQLRVVTWGLVPSWAKDRSIGARMINARVESVPTKPAFRKAFAKRRCLVPADGWYEWRTHDTADGPRKQPMYMTSEDGHVLAFAGLYEFWSPPDQPDGSGKPATLTTCTIITAPAEGPLAEIHDRMPLLLPRASWRRWLDPGVEDPSDLLKSWDEVAGERLRLRPVSPAVNKVDNNGPELLEPVDVQPEPQRLF